MYTRKLVYQAKYVTGASFRVRACEYAGSRPQAPTDGRLEKVIEVKDGDGSFPSIVKLSRRKASPFPMI
ncbi:MAG: hypothetical protein ACLUHA_12830 [Bacteroides stercoris]